MISESERDEFVQRVESWRCLNAEEQDVVISDAMMRFESKPNNEQVKNRVRWLMVAAAKIKKEIWRTRRQREKLRSAMVERQAIDRRKNGFPLGLPRTVSRSNEGPDCRSEQHQVCRDVLDALSPDERQLIDLCVFQELHPAEAGRTLSLDSRHTERVTGETSKVSRAALRRWLQTGATTVHISSCQLSTNLGAFTNAVCGTQYSEA